MTGDCHVRFCERLRGETPLCLLGEITKKSPFKISSEGDSLWAHLESNQAPTDYESVALTE